MKEDMYFDGFEHRADELRKFLCTAGIFSISLKSGKIVHYTPEDIDAFRLWLAAHNIEDMRES